MNKHPCAPALAAPLAVSEADAARLLGISRSTLRKGRLNGPRSGRMETPPWISMGRRILYRFDDLREFLHKRVHFPAGPQG